MNLCHHVKVSGLALNVSCQSKVEMKKTGFESTTISSFMEKLVTFRYIGFAVKDRRITNGDISSSVYGVAKLSWNCTDVQISFFSPFLLSTLRTSLPFWLKVELES